MESAFPPNYEEATRQDPLPLIARYLSRQALAKASRVSQKWYRAFATELWGNPAKHFNPALEDVNDIYDSFVRLLATIEWCRWETASLVRCLHIPPFSLADYSSISTALSSRTQRLSKLQALAVSGSSLFDHAMLITRHNHLGSSLRLLVARDCQNATERGLATFIKALPELEYLDLSYTRAASSPDTIESITFCHRLQVLKLRGVRLKRASLQCILDCVARQDLDFNRPLQKLRSLDVRDNGLPVDFDLAFVPAIRVSGSAARGVYDTVEYEKRFLQVLMDTSLERAPVNGPPDDEGITHWYLSGNGVGDGKRLGKELVKNTLRVVDVAGAGVLSANLDGLLPELAARSFNMVYLRISVDQLHCDIATARGADPPCYRSDNVMGESHVEEEKSIIRYFPALKDLVLAEIPSHVPTRQLITDLQTLIVDCAHQARVLGEESMSNRKEASLRLITLEVEAKAAMVADTYKTKLGYESADDDTTNLWEAAKDDFSFFENEKVTEEEPTNGKRYSVSAPMFDVIAELSEWRRIRRLAFEQPRSTNKSRLSSEHWQGQIRVIRTGARESNGVVQEDWDHFSGLSYITGIT